MGEVIIDSFPHSKLDCPVDSLLDSRCESYGSKLALRASLRYTGEDDQWQTSRSSLRDRNKYMFNRELFSDVRFLVGRAEKASIPAHRYILAISSPVFSSLFFAFGALQSELATREQVKIDWKGNILTTLPIFKGAQLPRFQASTAKTVVEGASTFTLLDFRKYMNCSLSPSIQFLFVWARLFESRLTLIWD